MIINNEEKEMLKGYLRKYVEMITEKSPDKVKDKYICPICHSGTGKKKTGGLSLDPKENYTTWTCFSCHVGGDIFNLVEAVEHITSFPEQVERLRKIFNLGSRTIEKPIINRNEREQAVKKTKKDYTLYINECKRNVGNILDYLHNRGLSNEIIEQFNLGYDPELYIKKLKQKEPSLIIPYNNNYYSARTINYHEFDKPTREEAGEEPIFNVEAFTKNKPVFICEAPLDALSIIQVGGEAVALGGTGTNKLLKYLEENPIENALILNFDNDNAGKKATETIKKELEELKINCTVAKYSYKQYKQNKDANDLLISDRKLFESEVKKNIELADPNEKHKNSNAFNLLKQFYKDIDPKKRIFIPTGFNELDKYLDGGLYAGLYILGAVSSLGKTTLALQIAENIAKGGKNVLIFSLEMGANELIAKSISRLTKNTETPKTSREIANGVCTDKEIEIINTAIEEFNIYSKRLYIFEGIGNIGAEEIKKEIDRHIKITGETPVILIDYLQILAPYELRATDKQNIDKSVLELKRISRDYKTPVIGISSFNRDNYNTAVSMTAFKESGALEYGSDVLLALQPSGMIQGTTDTDKKKNKEIVDKCKSTNERNLELVILKNRNGVTHKKVELKYYAMFNCFEENKTETTKESYYNPYKD